MCDAIRIWRHTEGNDKMSPPILSFLMKKTFSYRGGPHPNSVQTIYIILSVIAIIIFLSHVYYYDEQSQILIDYLNWILIPVGGMISILVGHTLKRSFIKHDMDYRKQLQHQNWLLQRLYDLSSNYYFPLAKFANDAASSIEKTSISPKTKSIPITFNYFGIFMKKYFEFKSATGANFLFRNRTLEEYAIKKFNSLLIVLPFNFLELNDMITCMFDNSGKFNPNSLKLDYYNWFEIWIKSVHCINSRNIVTEKLKDLYCTLDHEGENISHPEAYENQNKKIPSYRSTHGKFWIIDLDTKSAKSGDDLIVYGNGFNDTNVKYDFFIGDSKILKIFKKTNTFVIFKIPEKLNYGVYDVYAKFKIKNCGKNDHDNTIGIPLKINSA